MQLSNIDPDALQQMGRSMWLEYQKTCSSFEEASQQIVEDFHNLFRSQDDEPTFALVRVFRTMSFDELNSDLQAKADTSAADHFLTLMGTVGLESAWCDRRLSQKRQAIPINQNMSPMFKGIFQDLGFSWQDETGDDIVAGQDIHDMSFLRYFYVEDVGASTYITDQEQFVQPYGIQSAIAAGVQFVSQAAYVIIGFSRQHISPEQAEKLVQITPHLSTLLAIFDAQNALWAE